MIGLGRGGAGNLTPPPQGDEIPGQRAQYAQTTGQVSLMDCVHAEGVCKSKMLIEKGGGEAVEEHEYNPGELIDGQEREDILEHWESLLKMLHELCFSHQPPLLCSDGSSMCATCSLLPTKTICLWQSCRSIAVESVLAMYSMLMRLVVT